MRAQVEGRATAEEDSAGFCCQAPAAPPDAAKRQDLVSVGSPHYAATATGARLSLATVLFAPITVVAHRAKAYVFQRPSILFRPLAPSTTRVLVEPPGTAPGSDPSIARAFIAIAPVTRNTMNIGASGVLRKGADVSVDRAEAPRRRAEHPGRDRFAIRRLAGRRLSASRPEAAAARAAACAGSPADSPRTLRRLRGRRRARAAPAGGSAPAGRARRRGSRGHCR